MIIIDFEAPEMRCLSFILIDCKSYMFLCIIRKKGRRGDDMTYWFSVPEHIIAVLMIMLIIIIAEGIVISKLSKQRKKLEGADKIENTIEGFRAFWGEFIIYVLATSIIGIFIVSIVKRDNVTLADINSWVSIVLGLVALIVGIISLWLSFYNVDQANKSQRAIEKTADVIKNSKYAWQMEDGEWCYFDADGKMVRNEWKKSGNNWYHLGFDGYIERNKFIFENGNIYYVDEKGIRVNNTFIEIDGKKRYFGEDGKAFMNGRLVIDGKIHEFENGVLIKTLN